MRKSVVVGGPWRGVSPAVDPSKVPEGFVHDSRGFRFTSGSVVLGPGLEALRPHPLTRPTTTLLGDVFVEEDTFVGGTHQLTKAVGGSLVLDCGYQGSRTFVETFDQDPEGWRLVVNQGGADYAKLKVASLGPEYPSNPNVVASIDIKFADNNRNPSQYPPRVTGFYFRGDSTSWIGAYIELVLLGGQYRALDLRSLWRFGIVDYIVASHRIMEYTQGYVFTETFRIVVEVVGTSYKAKAWRLGQSEPSWQISTTITAGPYPGRDVGLIHATSVYNNGALYDNLVVEASGVLPCTDGTWVGGPYRLDGALVNTPDMRLEVDKTEPAQTSATVDVSFDGGTTWITDPSGNLDEVRDVWFRARLASSDPVASPAVHRIRLVYGVQYEEGFVTEFLYPLHVLFLRGRGLNDIMVFVTTDKVYLGDVNRVYDVTPEFPPELAPLGFTGWRADERSVLSVVQAVTDTTEWIILTSSDYPFMFRMEASGERFEVFRPPVGDDYLDVVGGRVVSVFAERLFFGHVYTSITEIPHAVAHYGVWGPFDNSFPTAGVMPLTGISGAVTAMAPVHDFLVVFKENGIYVGQATYDAEFPVMFRPRISSVGCKHQRAVLPLPGTKALCFLGSDGDFYLYDVNELRPVGAPVRNYLLEQPADRVTLFADVDAGEVYLVYPELILVWSYKEGWWAVDGNEVEVVGVASSTVLELAKPIDDNDGTPLDNMPGYIDESPGAITSPRACFLTRNGLAWLSPGVLRTGWVRTPEIRFQKPYHLARLEIRCKVARGATVWARHTLDTGATWAPWTLLRAEDSEGSVRFFYDFVAVSEQVMFEVGVMATQFAISDFVIDIDVKGDHEEVTPLARDFGG